MHIKTNRVLLALAAKHKMSCRQYDVSTAFLHASLKEEVYVKQPPGHIVKGKEDHVFRLKKAMYGLKNAPKAYSDFFMSSLRDLGFEQSTQDECLWILKKGGARVYYLFHVDDILCVSNDDLVRDYCFEKLKQKMRIIRIIHAHAIARYVLYLIICASLTGDSINTLFLLGKSLYLFEIARYVLYLIICASLSTDTVCGCYI